MKRETSGTYLLWKPRRHERHLEGVAVRVKRVEGIGVHGAEHGEHTARKLLTYCNTREATLGCAVLRNLLKLSVNYIYTPPVIRLKVYYPKLRMNGAVPLLHRMLL